MKNVMKFLHFVFLIEISNLVDKSDFLKWKTRPHRDTTIIHFYVNANGERENENERKNR